mgnify:CR=1 FL=1
MKIVPFSVSVVGGIAIAVIGYTAYWFVAAGEIDEISGRPYVRLIGPVR